MSFRCHRTQARPTTGRFSAARRPPIGSFTFGSQTGYRCFPNRPGLLRKPDASFIRGRLENDAPPDGDLFIAPDLVVESISPNDTYEDIEVKIIEYLGAGVRLVWIISPTAKTVMVRRPDKSCQSLGIGDTLSGEAVLPGFTLPLAELFD